MNFTSINAPFFLGLVSYISSFRAVLTVVLVVCSHYSLAKPLPGEMRDIMGGYFIIEEGYRNADWALANAQIDEMLQLFYRVEQTLFDTADDKKERQLIAKVYDALKTLKNHIADEDKEKSHASFIALQAPVLNLVEVYDYQQHPIIDFILEENEERIEAVEYGDANYEDLMEETEEIEEVLEVLEGLFDTESVLSGIRQAQLINAQLEKSIETENDSEILTLIAEFNTVIESLPL